jgi:hypothetical protein
LQWQLQWRWQWPVTGLFERDYMNVKIPVGLGCLAECRFSTSTSTSTPAPHPSALLFTSLVIESSQVEWSATQAQASLCLAREQHHTRLVLLVLPRHDQPLLEPFISRLEQSNERTSGRVPAHLTLQWRSRAAHAITSLHSYGAKLGSGCLSTLAFRFRFSLELHSARVPHSNAGFRPLKIPTCDHRRR